MTLLTIISCGKYGEGGRNACQFVKEQVPGLRDDIKNVEVIAEDSLLSDMMLAFGQPEFAKAGTDFWEGTISRDDYARIIDSTTLVLQDVANSWQYSNVVNDSLRRLKKYEDEWRKVYTVRVTMKSGVTRDARVLMDRDGRTPRTLENDFMKKLEEYQQIILEADKDCHFGQN